MKKEKWTKKNEKEKMDKKKGSKDGEKEEKKMIKMSGNLKLSLINWSMLKPL